MIPRLILTMILSLALTEAVELAEDVSALRSVAELTVVPLERYAFSAALLPPLPPSAFISFP